MQPIVLIYFLLTIFSGTVMMTALRFLSNFTPALVQTISGLTVGVVSLCIRLRQRQHGMTTGTTNQFHRIMIVLGVSVLCVNIGYSLLYGQKVSLAYAPIIITGGMTILLGIVGALFFHEPMSWKFLVGSACIVIGMIVMVR